MDINDLKLNDALKVMKSLESEESFYKVTPPKPLESVVNIEPKKPGTVKKVVEIIEESCVKEILLIRESQIEVVKYYLDSIVHGNYIYYETLGTYKLIESLRPNLLRESYWVISTFGKFGLEPRDLDYDNNVLSKYLNHVIISSNWGIFNDMNKDDWTYVMDYGGYKETYKVKTISSFDEHIIREYIKRKLGGVAKDPYEMERYQTTLVGLGVKNIVENTNKFISMHKYPIEEIVKEIKAINNISYKINELMKLLTLNIKYPSKSRSPKKRNWNILMSQVMENYGESYLLKSMVNGVEALIEIKTTGNSKHMSTKFFKEFVNDVDFMNLVSIRYCLSHKDVARVLIELDKYMNNPRDYLIRVREV